MNSISSFPSVFLSILLKFQLFFQVLLFPTFPSGLIYPFFPMVSNLPIADISIGNCSTLQLYIGIGNCSTLQLYIGIGNCSKLPVADLGGAWGPGPPLEKKCIYFRLETMI